MLYDATYMYVYMCSVRVECRVSLLGLGQSTKHLQSESYRNTSSGHFSSSCSMIFQLCVLLLDSVGTVLGVRTIIKTPASEGHRMRD